MSPRASVLTDSELTGKEPSAPDTNWAWLSQRPLPVLPGPTWAPTAPTCSSAPCSPIAPIAFGLDKFAGLLTDWEQYLAPWINDLVPGSAHQAMLAVGVIEVVAGIAVAVAPRYGALLVAGWLAGIILNLVTMGEYYDVALRDFGLLVGALALAFLAFDRGRTA